MLLENVFHLKETVNQERGETWGPWDRKRQKGLSGCWWRDLGASGLSRSHSDTYRVEQSSEISGERSGMYIFGRGQETDGRDEHRTARLSEWKMERQWRVVGGIIEEKQGQPNHTRKMRELERHDNRTACLLECVYSTVKIACVDFICNQNIVTVLEICGRVRQNGWWQFQFSSIQSLSRVGLFATPWTAARRASLSITNSQGLPITHVIEWCHPTISSSVIPFSSCPQSCPASGSFPVSQLFASGGQRLEFQFQHQSFQWIFRTDFL